MTTGIKKKKKEEEEEEEETTTMSSEPPDTSLSRADAHRRNRPLPDTFVALQIVKTRFESSREKQTNTCNLWTVKDGKY